MSRDAWIEIDLNAIAHNVSALQSSASGAQLWAVVKADGYGHGALPVARQALDAGASGLAVALVDEGVALRHAGIEAPILVLSEPSVGALNDLVEHRLIPTVYRIEMIDALQLLAERTGIVVEVHVMVDTGMRRVGIQTDEVVDVVRKVVDSPNLKMAGLSTHFAVADEPDHLFTQTQIDRFDAAVEAVIAAGLPTGLIHASNSAATIRSVGTYDVTRCGIAIYGLDPSPELAGLVELHPALSLHARVSFVKSVAAGEGVSYGLHYAPSQATQIVTVPLGYADGVRRDLSIRGGEVLIGGRRYRIVGTITMDQLLVDCGPSGTVAVGDEVVLLGEQGAERITAQDWADQLDTITYEIVCAFNSRLPRRYHKAQCPLSN